MPHRANEVPPLFIAYTFTLRTLARDIPRPVVRRLVQTVAPDGNHFTTYAVARGEDVHRTPREEIFTTETRLGAFRSHTEVPGPNVETIERLIATNRNSYDVR